MTSNLSVSQQARLLHWAVGRGLVSPGELDQGRSDGSPTLSEADISDQFRRLFLEGRLKDRLGEALEGEPGGGSEPASSDPLRLLGEGPVLNTTELEGFPLPRDGRYLPLAFLGEGGMGRVYKVFDRQLKRMAAVKFLKHLDQGPLERFLQEARAQAQVDHPHVCNIFSVDEHRGQPYLTMRFIPGPTLKEAMGQLSLVEKCRIAQQLAQALQACHSLGIVHRDLKPGNIMLEHREDGQWWPYLLDFGLARDLADSSLTMQGMILGTPTYCSPEQVQGQMAAVDARSDIYALGATLYECLGGEPPFPHRGDLLELIQRICTEDPVSLSVRFPNLPRDLLSIVAKTLEKDPARRYPTAQALAEDLGRFLAGDPILAKGAHHGNRLVRELRRHPASSLLGLAGVVAVLACAGLAGILVWRSRVQTQSGFEFGREAEHLEMVLRRAYILPLHDLGPERSLVEQRLARIQASLPRLGRWSRPAAHLALGRGLLALDRPEEARRELELGSGGPGRVAADPDTALALGLTLARLYEAELEGLYGKPLADRKQALEPSLRQPALACLGLAQGAHQDGPAFVEGLMALVEGREPEAIRKARDYQALAPWAFEGPLLETQACHSLAFSAFNAGQFDQAEADLAQGRAALGKAFEVAHSAPAVLIAETQLDYLALQIRLARGQAVAADRDAALAATAACLKANPGDWRALNYQAGIHRFWAMLQLGRGQDPGASLDAAIAAAEAGLRVRPEDNPLWTTLGSALRNRADWEFSQGRDPTLTLGRAIQAQRQALVRPVFRDRLLDSIGCCYSIQGRYQLEHGQDPGPAIAAAVTCLDQAAALVPWVGHLSVKGGTLQDLATYITITGGDPRPRLIEARRAFEAALQLNGHSYQAQLGLASLLLDWADAAQVRAQPDLAALAEAREHLAQVLSLNPDQADPVHSALARAHALEALAHAAEPGPRQAALQAAGAELAKVGPAARRNPETALALAETYRLLQQADPRRQPAAAGLAVLAPALVQRPWDGFAVHLQGRLLAALGRHEAAERAFQAAAQRNPNLTRAAR